MSHTSTSTLTFGLYIGLLSLVLVFFPGPLFDLFGLPAAQDYWILVAGMLLFGLAGYYGYAAIHNLRGFMRLMAFGRTLVLPYFLVLVLLDKAPAPILILGAIDLLFAAWTFIALRQDRVAPPAGS